jgi:creatinine amidohydrolase
MRACSDHHTMIPQRHDDRLERVCAATGTKPVRLENLPWPEIAPLRDQNGGLLLLPLGATEQHGPHLPINTDTLIAESTCWYASAKTNVPVLPVLPYTVSVGHTAKWPGTFSLWHETFIAALRQISTWIVATGWKRLLLVNSHFGNDASIRVAIDQIRLAHIGSLHIAAGNTFNLTRSIWDYFTSDAEDLHANKAETDLLLFLAPELVRIEQIQDDPDRTSNSVFSYPVAQTSINGVTGAPSAATVEQGKRLFHEIGDALTALVERAKNDSPPLESDHWRDLSQPISFQSFGKGFPVQR